MRPYFLRMARAACAYCLLVAASSFSFANVLVNPGFETDALLGAPLAGLSGWNSLPTANTASKNGHPTHSGIGSLRLDVQGDGVADAFQTFAANPGEVWDFQGYMLATFGALAPPSFGLLKIVWSNGAMDLAPVLINFGVDDPFTAAPGIMASPLLDVTNADGLWHFARAQGVAPAGTTEVKFFALLVTPPSGSALPGATAYFDDLQANRVPEPGTLALLLAALLAIPLGRKRSA